MTARVVVADDHPIVIRGLRELLEAEGFSIVGTAKNGDEAIDHIAKLTPDLLILDLGMPGTDGMSVLRQMQGMQNPPAVVVLSLHTERELVDGALKLGARAYVLKDNALDGRPWTSPRLHESFDDDPLARLTPAELRVIRLLAENKTSPQIAAELHLSVRTVQNHRAHACEKLGFTGAHRLLQFALENRERVRAMTADD